MRWKTALLPFLLGLWTFGIRPSEPAPVLEATDSYGHKVVFRGSWTVLWFYPWFYPKAKTPGCTLQAKRYAELYEDFRALGAKVYGVSRDPAGEQVRR